MCSFHHSLFCSSQGAEMNVEFLAFSSRSPTEFYQLEIIQILYFSKQRSVSIVTKYRAIMWFFSGAEQ